jgi:hypothetical protein
MWPWFGLCFELVVIWIIGSGGDKAPLPGMVKARTRLMPDSHNDGWENLSVAPHSA